MDLKDMAIRVRDLLKKFEPIFALLFLILAIIGIVNLVQYVSLQGQIKETCGWEDESVKCFCEQKDYYERWDVTNNPNDINLNLSPGDS